MARSHSNDDSWETEEEFLEISEDDISSGDNITEFTGVAFGMFSSREVRKISVCEINDSKLSGEGTVYDPRMGVLKNHALCVTCNKSNDKCTGHFGHIELPVPIAHPMYPEEILMYLNCFCGECSCLLVSNKEMKLLNMFSKRGASRMKAIIDYTSKVKVCPNPKCETDKWSYYVEEYKYYKYKGEKSEKTEMSFLEIENVLGSIKKSDLKDMGLNEKGREIDPVDFIITSLLVLPICARPFVETNRGPCDDDLTSKYIEIVKRCNSIKHHFSKTKILKEKELSEKKDGLLFHIRTLMYNYQFKARQINGRPIKCIRERMNGKGGLFRQNLSGKRNDFTGRTVIDPDPTLRADEIAIPEEFSEKLTFPERVFDLNIEVLEELVNNGKANYVKRLNPATKEIDSYDLKKNLRPKNTYESGGFVIQLGDIVLRDGKKISPEKFKEAVGREITLLQSDKIARGGKILKGFKLPEKILFDLESGDIIYRDGQCINPRLSERVTPFELRNGDRVIRGGKELKNISVSKRRVFKLQSGDIVERHLRDGDIVLFGRQPTLHKGSMIARKIKIMKNTSGINNHKPIRCIRMNLAQCKTYNSDFDGDEMNIYVPQSYEAVAELQLLSSTSALLKSSQSARLLLSITQDALTGGNLFTRGFYYNEMVDGKNVRRFNPRNYISKEIFWDALTCVSDWFSNSSRVCRLSRTQDTVVSYTEDTRDYIFKKMDHIRDVLRWRGFSEAEILDYSFTGHCLFSFLLPDDFEYLFEPSGVEITRGVLLKGILNKSVLGDSHSSIVHKIEKEYGAKTTIDFVSYYQWLINHCLKSRGFSIGIEDCLPIRVKDVQNQISKSFMEAQTIETSENDLELRERKVNNALNSATTIGQLITKNEFEYENALNVMISAGSKGSYVNNSQIRVLVGQQNVDGRRIPTTFGGRTNPSYSFNQGVCPPNSSPEQEEMERKLLYESRGFVSHCYMEGLSLQEFFFHAEGGREGVIDTAVKTAKSGYIQRKLVKKMEDLVKSYSDGLVVNSKNMVIQFNYGRNFDPARLVRINDSKMSFANVKNITESLNSEKEWEDWKNK